MNSLFTVGNCSLHFATSYPYTSTLICLSEYSLHLEFHRYGCSWERFKNSCQKSWLLDKAMILHCRQNSVCSEMDEVASSKLCSRALHMETSVGVGFLASQYLVPDRILKLQLTPTDTETFPSKHSYTSWNLNHDTVSWYMYPHLHQCVWVPLNCKILTSWELNEMVTTCCRVGWQSGTVGEPRQPPAWMRIVLVLILYSALFWHKRR